MIPRGWGVLLALLAAPGFADPARLELDAKLDPATRELRADGVLVVGRSAAVIALAARFRVDAFTVDGRRNALAGTVREGRREWRLPAAARERRVEIAWHGTLDPLDESLSHRDTLSDARPVAGERGSFLPGSTLWHPTVAEGLAGYRVDITVPAGQKALVAGRLVREHESGGEYRARFEFPHPAEGIDLIAGPYEVESRDVRSAAGTPLRLRTYFHTEIAPLSTGYLDSVQGYIDRYEGWIGAYPYSEFSVVSSPTPTGFGMPTLTYLGIDVLRLPFIRATSLGHEVLHNWWGNGVSVDYARGNWSEGLTTFMADYRYKEDQDAGAAREMRLEWLRDFAAMPAGEDRPLNRFIARHHGASQIVGYNKAAMTFLMLRDLIGSEAFDAGIREFWRAQRYRAASWSDLQRAFEQASKRDLAAFFAQWLDRAGAPALRIAEARAAASGASWKVTAILVQGAPPYDLRVPLVLRTESGAQARVADLSADRQVVTFETDARPKALALDPELRLFRRLAPGEAPPILRQVMIDPATALAILSGGAAADAARKLAGRLLDYAATEHTPDGPLPDAPLLVIGLAGEIDAWLATKGLAPQPSIFASNATAQVWAARRSDGRALVAVSARDAAALAALLRPLPHYGRQSWIAFDGAKVIERGVWPSIPQEVPLD